MGAALLAVWEKGGIRPETGAAFERVLASFPPRVRRMSAARHRGSDVLALVSGHESVRTFGFAEDPASGSWLTVIGNPVREDLASLDGPELLARILAEVRAQGQGAIASLSPPFALLTHDGTTATTTLAVDRAGLQHVYFAEDPRGRIWLSSSSIALAAVIPLVPDARAIAEWLAAGHFLSQRTLLRGITKVGPGQTVTLSAAGVALGPVDRPDPTVHGREPVAAYVDALLRSVRAQGRGPGLASELTGGLDSRVVLAALLREGTPFLAWTFGQAGCAELRTIARLRRTVAFEHHVVPLTAEFAADLPERIEEMHGLCEGEVNALEYAPLLHAFAGLEGRRSVSLSGGGGEIGRGFYYSCVGPGGLDGNALLHRLSAASGALPRILRPEVARDPLEPLRAAIEEFRAGSAARTPHSFVEDLYLRGRMQRFAGRNITTTGLFCRQGLPFFGNELVDLCLALPPGLKQDGGVVRAALFAPAPSLAGITLDSGLPAGPSSRLRPDRIAQRGVVLMRKALRRYAAPLGHRLGLLPPETVPWQAARQDVRFRSFVADMLLRPEARVTEWLEPRGLRALLEGAFAGGSMFPLGLVLTLELTLRAAAAARDGTRGGTRPPASAGEAPTLVERTLGQ